MSEESFHSFTTQTAADRKSTPSKTKEHVPHYLRASTGSCHDLCKYGKQVAEESQLLAKKKKKKAITKPDPTEKVKVKPMPKSKPPLSEDLQMSKLKTCVSYTSKATKPDVPSSDHKLHLSVKITASNRAVSTDDVKKKSSKTVALRRSLVKGHERGSDSGNAGSELVVSRHEEVEEKKEAKGLLLNNVIEETASKLSGTNKSKVKVLVGAFETVIISLQDR